jgi:hypothetical protein
VGEFFLDLLLPKTDKAAITQWIVMGVVWTIVVAATWRIRREYRLFLYGLAMINVAWFAARTVH